MGRGAVAGVQASSYLSLCFPPSLFKEFISACVCVFIFTSPPLPHGHVMTDKLNPPHERD